MRGSRACAMLRRWVTATARGPPFIGTAARSSSSITHNLILSSTATAAAASCCTVLVSEDGASSFLFPQVAPAGPAAAFHSSFLTHHCRSFSSSPSTSSSSDPSKVVLIVSEEQFNDSLRKVQDESLPAIFYFTAEWCGPCRLLSPIIGQLSVKYPHVTTYKIDIDKEGLANALSKLNIHSVPTLHLFQNGKKAGEVIGADVERLKDTMETLYK